MNQKLTRILLLTLVLAVFGAVPAMGQVIYDSTVSPQPGNLPSVGAEAYAFKELGDNITFAGSARRARSVTITMSSFACQSGAWFSADCATRRGATFSIPIRLNIYNAGSPTPGALIATKTQTFAIPYRPSVDPTCGGGRWRQASTGMCFNGLAYNIKFDLKSLHLTLPNSIVYGITYNTSHYGPSPIGEAAPCFSTSAGCFYDSLNIGLGPVVTVGTKSFFNTLYWNNAFAANYCDGGLAGTGTFRLDSPTNACWAGYVPAAQFKAKKCKKERCSNDDDEGDDDGDDGE